MMYRLPIGRIAASGVCRKFSRGGPKFRHNRVTSHINFMWSAKGTENQNSGQTPNTRNKPSLLLLKLLGFVLHFSIFRV